MKSTNTSRPTDVNFRRLFSGTNVWRYLQEREQGLEVQVISKSLLVQKRRDE